MTENNGNQKNFKGKNKKASEEVKVNFPDMTPAERAVIGAVLKDNDVFDTIEGILQPEHFSDPLNSKIWKVMLDEFDAGGAAYATLIQGKMSARDAPNMTLLSYLNDQCITAAAATSAVRKYASDIVSASTRLNVYEMCERLQRASLDPEKDIGSALEEEYAKLDDQKEDEVKIISLADSIDGVLEEAVETRVRGADLCGITTGFKKLDEMTGGVEPGHFVMIAGRTSHGKTALSLNMATAQALAGIPVGYVSLETKERQLSRRLLAAESGMPSRSIKRGLFTDSEYVTLHEIAKRMKGLPFHLVEPQGGLTPAKLRLIVRKLVRQHGVKAVYVDYIQLMEPGKNAGKGDYERITSISRAIRPIINETGVPIFALAQLNRQTENRAKEEWKPRKSDLKGSGQLEQDADIAIFIYREYEMLKEREPGKNDKEYNDWRAQMIEAKDKALLIVGKNKDGETGSINMKFDGPSMKFSESW
jgi:replicative DNA helicase